MEKGANFNCSTHRRVYIGRISVGMELWRSTGFMVYQAVGAVLVYNSSQPRCKRSYSFRPF